MRGVENPRNPINARDNGLRPEQIDPVPCDGPVWNRFYNSCVAKGNDKRLKEMLRDTQTALAQNETPAVRLVCAHTIVNQTAVRKGTNDASAYRPEQHPAAPEAGALSVWFIDVMMTEGYGAGERWGAIEIRSPRHGTSTVEVKGPPPTLR